MSPVVQFQDLGESDLTLNESIDLRRQLKNLPPEAADLQDLSLYEDICERCWSIIYRPLLVTEKL